jgi:hypothetical protein
MSYNSLILHPFHLKPTLPAGHWLAAYGASGLLARWPKLRPLGRLAGVMVIAASLATLDQPLRSNAARPVGNDLDSATLGAARQIGTDLRRFMDAYGLDEVYVGLPDVTPTAWAGRPLAAVSWFKEPDLLIIPLGRPSLYVRYQVGSAPGPLPLAQQLHAQTWPGQGIVTYDLLPALTYSEAAAVPAVSIGWPSNTGLTLLGYSLEPAPRVGAASRMTTYWVIETLVDTRSQFIFGSYAHLNNQEGATLVNAGAAGLPGYYYRQGDLYIQSFQLSIPADVPTGTYLLELGLYDGLHQTGTTFYPPNGTPRPFYTADVDVLGASSVSSH